jgi:4-azaleucine resistance transporter AzlC
VEILDREVLPTPAQAPVQDSRQLSFGLRGVREGLQQSIPIALGVFGYGLVFGVLAGQTGLSLVEVGLMSSLVFAGSSQFAALGLWVMPLPISTIIITTLIINLRHLLMGAALRAWFEQLSLVQRYVSLFFMADENWALIMSRYAKGNRNGALLLGSGLAIFLAWTSSTLLGRALGSFVQDPARWGLDFAFTAAILALLAGMWRGKTDLLPWLVAGLVAVVTSQWLPGKWYILLGGLAGSLVGAMRNAD